MDCPTISFASQLNCQKKMMPLWRQYGHLLPLYNRKNAKNANFIWFFTHLFVPLHPFRGMGDSQEPLILVLINNNMIDKNIVKTAVNEWLEKGDYYLVDLEMTADDRIVIEIDHADGVWIEDCADLSRFLQEKLGEELGDYELEVGSAGIGQPFKVIQQYRNHIGKDVEVLASDGKKFQGVLKEVSDDDAQFVVTVKEKQQVEGKKRPVLVEVDKTFAISDIKYCKYLLSFK